MSDEELDVCMDTAMSKVSTMTPSNPPSSSISMGDVGEGGLYSDNLAFEANEPSNNVRGGNGNGVAQQSSPQHNSSYRHSRAYRHFKNPPQPHMCIRTTTQTGEELFINVLSWTRIVIPQEPSDPIPLYGGMRVPPGSPRCPPLVYAVMANPEVLKDSGRHSKDPEERGAMVELMCDFVEAMNPGVKLTRNAVILKDRDISGELKDVWNAVQAQRDREREEQIVHQRQQQHYHNITTQQMFPKMQQQQPQNPEMQQQQQMQNNSLTGDNKVLYTEFGPDANGTNQLQQQQQEQNQQQYSSDHTNNLTATNNAGAQSAINISANNSLNRLNENDHHCDDVTDSSKIQKQQQQQQISSTINQVNNSTENSTKNSQSSSEGESATTQSTATAANTTTTTTTTTQPLPPTTTTTTTPTAAAPTPAPAPAPAAPPAATATPTKKEKLAGFLPNGCIFPRFKNNKHKDKDKDKEKDKESSKPSKDKERTLLNSLKSRSKDKQQHENNTAADSGKTQYEKNCINLESEVEKLDLNKIDSTSNSSDMLIKLKVATSGGGK